MTVRLVLRTLAARPLRSAVLAGGFGLGIAVMAALLGVGEVVLEQARSPALRGGGDLVVTGESGDLASARYLLGAVLARGGLADEVRAASPSKRRVLYLVEEGGGVTALRAQAGIPSHERALGDPETSGVAAWVDSDRDRAWASPAAGEVLRELDRFHPIPEAPAYADSWAEWLYFNGRNPAGDLRFYLTFLAGARGEAGRRMAGVRLQLERAGETRTYASVAEVDEAALLARAPDLEFGASRVRLEGTTYRIHLELTAEAGGEPGVEPLTADLALEADPGRSLPPLVLRGRGGWISGYVVPVLAGALSGEIAIGRERVSLAGATGYHDHNWGFWRGVTWQWGTVAHEGLSIVYGRVRPPADAADPGAIPGFLAAFAEEGIVGATMDVAIVEEAGEEGGPGGDGPPGSEKGPSAAERPGPPDRSEGTPRTIRVRARGAGLDLALVATPEASHLKSRIAGPMAAGSPLDFLQMRARYEVRGTLAGRRVEFAAPGSAETFRGAAAP